jgi:hypothetical protein
VGQVTHLQVEDIETLSVTLELPLLDDQALSFGPLSLRSVAGTVTWTAVAGRAIIETLEPAPVETGVMLMAQTADVTPSEVTFHPSSATSGRLVYAPATLSSSVRAVTFTLGGVDYAAQRTDTWSWEAEVSSAGENLMVAVQVLDGDALFTSGLLNVSSVGPVPVGPTLPPLMYLADRPLVTPFTPGQTVRVSLEIPIHDAFGSLVVDLQDVETPFLMTFAALNRDLTRVPRLVRL